MLKFAAREGKAVLLAANAHRTRVGAAATALIIAGLIGYFAGTRAAGVADLTGHASVGVHVATIEADGWSYGVSGSVPWIDPSGLVYDRGWPSCLEGPGEVARVRFGAVPVTMPDGGSQQIVVYVDCRR